MRRTRRRRDNPGLSATATRPWCYSSTALESRRRPQRVYRRWPAWCASTPGCLSPRVDAPRVPRADLSQGRFACRCLDRIVQRGLRTLHARFLRRISSVDFFFMFEIIFQTLQADIIVETLIDIRIEFSCGIMQRFIQRQMNTEKRKFGEFKIGSQTGTN